MPGPRGSRFQICSFAIPLITIVAFFVFSLFLPIVVFVFQLWFLLTLRFCIPPDVNVGGGFDAELTAIGGGLSIDAGAVVAIESDPALGTKIGQLLNGTTFNNQQLGDAVKAAAMPGPGQQQTMDTTSFGSLLRGVFAAKVAPPRTLMYAKRVERSEVVRP